MGERMRMVMVFVLILNIHGSNGDLQRFEHRTRDDGSLTVLVVGDWGRKGDYNQSRIAHQMGIIAKDMDIDFVISTGDNFYDDGLSSTFDEAFDQSFTDIYTAPSLQKTWYNDFFPKKERGQVNFLRKSRSRCRLVLGNHDYRGDALAQLSPILKAKDNRWFCMKSFILDTDIAEFFFIDTTPFQDKYFTNPKDHVYDWRCVIPRDKYLSTLLQDLETSLIESKAQWKIVVGHHTIKSASDHGNTQELVDKILPIFEANGVNLYINGHDHCLQHISSSHSPLQFLTSGGGSKAWRGIYNWPSSKGMKYFYDGQGFMTLHITHHQIEVIFYDISGNILHKWTAASHSFISAL